MNIYLDIDGTLIHENLIETKPANGLTEFLIALRPYDTYWLTTHCRDGNPERPREIMKKYLPEELHGEIERIKPTTWGILKTQGIDWSKDFIWFDNEISAGEWDMLKNCTDTQSVIEIDLRSNPNQLIEITRDIEQRLLF